MSNQPEALYLAQILQSADEPVSDAAAAELRRLHAENERLGNLCYDYIGELTAMRAAKQMQKRIDELKKMQERTLTDEVIADLWHQNGGFHHHFARAVERWLKGQA